MRVDYDVAMEVAAHEAVVRQAYRNAGDVLTWSVGLTSATGHMVERYIGKPQSLEHCLRVYVWALDNYADAVRRVFADTRLTKAQFAAVLSFHWNTGAIGSATWVKHFKAGKMAAAEKAFKAWNKSDGKVSDGLVKRRAAEADLLFRGKWSNDGTMTEWTRVKPGGAIDWSSGKRIDVSAALRAALAGEIPASDKVIVEREKEVVPEAVEQEVKRKTGLWGWLTTLLGTGGAGVTALLGADWKSILAFGGLALGGVVILAFVGPQIARSLKRIRAELV